MDLQKIVKESQEEAKRLWKNKPFGKEVCLAKCASGYTSEMIWEHLDAAIDAANRESEHMDTLNFLLDAIEVQKAYKLYLQLKPPNVNLFDLY